MRTFYEEDGFDQAEISAARAAGEGILFVGKWRQMRTRVVRSRRELGSDVPKLVYFENPGHSIKDHLLAQVEAKRLGLPSESPAINRQEPNAVSVGRATDA